MNIQKEKAVHAMLEAILTFLKSGILFELLIYISIVAIALVAAGRCFTPLRSITRALRRATRTLADETKREVAQPSWNDVHFLGVRLESAWASFLQNAEARDAHGETCDVADYINVETVIEQNPGKQLGEMAPGIMVSLGILGTFLGLVTGLSGLSLIEDTDAMLTAIQQLISGMSTAFLTSIFGVVASLIFNLFNRSMTGKCERALARFVETFQRCAMPKPVDDGTSLVTMQQEQTAYMRQMVEEIAIRMSTQMEQSILRAMLPVQRSMDNFIVAATREQVEGIDRVAARFVERMNLALDGEFAKLGQTLEQVRANNTHTQEDLRAASEAIKSMTQDVINMHQLSQGVLEQFKRYVDDMALQKGTVEKACIANGQAIDHLNDTMQAQIQALVQLNEYKGQLQKSQQEYLRMADKFLGGVQRQLQGTTQELERVSLKMENASALLNSSYLSFSEQIENGLVKAAAIMDESVQSTMTQMARSLEDVRGAAREMTNIALRAAKNTGEGATLKQPLRAPGAIRTAAGEEESGREGA